MRKTVLGLTAAMAMVAGGAWADEKVDHEKKGEQAKTMERGLNEVKGTIDVVKTAQNEVVIKALPEKKELTTLHVDKDTTIFVDGRTGALSDLKEGQEVRASFEEKAGMKHANWIEVTTAGPMMKEREEKPTTPGSPEEPKNPEQGKPY